MYGKLFKVALLTPIAVLISLIVDAIIGEQLAIMEMAPGGKDTAVYGFTAAVGDNFLLLVMMSLFVLLIGGALVEREVGGGIR